MCKNCTKGQVQKDSFSGESFLEGLQKQKQYKDMEKLTKTVLSEQWENAVLSGMLNDLYKNYTRFFKRKYKKKIKKQEDEEMTDAELLDLAKKTPDKFVLGLDNLKQLALLAYINKLVSNNTKSVGSYLGFKPAFNNYLKWTANKAGQSIIDQIPTPKIINFRLSNAEIKAKLTRRINMLIPQLDKVSKKNLSKELYNGVINKTKRTELLNNLKKKGIKLSDTRSRRIVLTETESAGEYIRWQTANLNGVRTKRWVTTNPLERICPLCKELDMMEVPINEPFRVAGIEVQAPGLHTLCACMLEYDILSSLADNYIDTEKSFSEKVKDIYNKFIKAKDDFYSTSNKGSVKIININAIWAGGESLVGSDKNIRNIYEDIKSKGHKMDRDRLLEEAKQKLSPEGVVQLRAMLGLSPNINL